MEVQDSKLQPCKRSRAGAAANGGTIKLATQAQHRDNDDDDDGEAKTGGVVLRPTTGWHHPSSRIYRVSRASGGKDRHSKVYTAKGLRDRRVRLSVSTAIQFYDLQDRLGYDQPSKAIEWLIKAAASAIAELPTLEGPFLEAPSKADPNEEKPNPEAEPSYNKSKSGCSSTSETSKGSVLSLSRSESRVKARKRARERTAKDKDNDDGHAAASTHQHHQNANPTLNSQTSFTELLTGGSSSSNGAAVATSSAHLPPVTTTADYFSQAGNHQLPSGFSSHVHFGNSSQIGIVHPLNNAAAMAAAGDHPEMFSFLQDHLFPVAAAGAGAAAAAAAGGDYNLNFPISSGLAGFHRGTLQSNSPPSHLPHHHHYHVQRLSFPVDGSNLPFLLGSAATAAPAAAAATNGNPYSAAFDGHLQLCYGDGYRHSELKGKEKS